MPVCQDCGNRARFYYEIEGTETRLHDPDTGELVAFGDSHTETIGEPKCEDCDSDRVWTVRQDELGIGDGSHVYVDRGGVEIVATVEKLGPFEHPTSGPADQREEYSEDYALVRDADERLHVARIDELTPTEDHE